MLHPPKVPYKETITQRAEVQGRHKKQTGGRGQFGDCKVVFEPLPRGGGFTFEDKIFGGSVPQQFRPAIEKGIIESRLTWRHRRLPTGRFQSATNRRLVSQRRLRRAQLPRRGP